MTELDILGNIWRKSKRCGLTLYCDRIFSLGWIARF